MCLGRLEPEATCLTALPIVTNMQPRNNGNNNPRRRPVNRHTVSRENSLTAESPRPTVRRRTSAGDLAELYDADAMHAAMEGLSLAGNLTAQPAPGPSSDTSGTIDIVGSSSTIDIVGDSSSRVVAKAHVPEAAEGLVLPSHATPPPARNALLVLAPAPTPHMVLLSSDGPSTVTLSPAHMIPSDEFMPLPPAMPAHAVALSSDGPSTVTLSPATLYADFPPHMIPSDVVVPSSLSLPSTRTPTQSRIALSPRAVPSLPAVPSDPMPWEVPGAGIDIVLPPAPTMANLQAQAAYAAVLTPRRIERRLSPPLRGFSTYAGMFAHDEEPALPSVIAAIQMGSYPNPHPVCRRCKGQCARRVHKGWQGHGGSVHGCSVCAAH